MVQWGMVKPGETDVEQEQVESLGEEICCEEEVLQWFWGAQTDTLKIWEWS